MANSITADLGAATISAATIAAAAAGDTLALERIIAQYHLDLARVCVVICGGDADLAEDAVQAAWLIAWRKLGGLRDPDRLRSWLVAVAANEARRQTRRRRGRLVELNVADAAAADDIGRAPAAIDLRAALQRLKPEDREILALRHVAGLDSAEIGRVVGMSPSGVRTRLERLLARLRSELSDD